MRNLLEDRVLRRAWTVCRLTGSLRFPAPQVSTSYSEVQERPRFRSFVAEKIASLRRASHAQSLLESFNNSGNRLRNDEPLPATLGRSRNGEHGRASLVSAHISSPRGAETTLGCTAADRAVV